MERFSIRQLEEKDLDFVYRMTVRERWNVTIDDVKRMFSYEPNGNFIAEAEGSSAGHVFTVRYGELGWIGLLIVKAEHRKKGVGTMLTKKAIDYLLDCEVKTIRLEAVPRIADLYRKLGFIDQFDSLRFRGTSERIVSGRSRSVALIEREDMTKIGEFDAAYFGADRTRVLASLYKENPKLCFVSHEGSDVAGYIMCRKAISGYAVGPFVCNPENPQVAGELLARCAQKLGLNEMLYVGVPAVNEKATKMLRESGFHLYSKSIRMRFGKSIETEKASGIFAIGGAMKG